MQLSEGEGFFKFNLNEESLLVIKSRFSQTSKHLTFFKIQNLCKKNYNIKIKFLKNSFKKRIKKIFNFFSTNFFTISQSGPKT